MKYLLVGLLLTALTTSSTFAQSDQKSEKILDKISSEIKGLNSFYIEFTMNTKNQATGENSTKKGNGYVKGNKYYAEVGNNVLISNGLKNWTVVKDSKVTYQSDVDPNSDDALSPQKIMTIWESGFKSRYDKKTTLNEKSMHQISLFPIHPGEVSYFTIVLYINSSNNQLSSAIMKSKDGSIITYTITKFVKNSPVVDSIFVYNPKNYPGYQLVRN